MNCKNISIWVRLCLALTIGFVFLMPLRADAAATAELLTTIQNESSGEAYVIVRIGGIPLDRFKADCLQTPPVLKSGGKSYHAAYMEVAEQATVGGRQIAPWTVLAFIAVRGLKTGKVVIPGHDPVVVDLSKSVQWYKPPISMKKWMKKYYRN
jgi:hypothetical protein